MEDLENLIVMEEASAYKEEEEIRQLTDDIIALIISRLELREAVRTSIVSTRWKYLWTGISRLNFETPKELWDISKNERYLTMDEKQSLVNWVNEVLDSHNSGFVQKFRICLPLDHSHGCQLDKWLKFAISRKPESLEIDLREFKWRDSTEYYALPQQYFGRGSAGTFFFKSLKSLSLAEIVLDDQMVKFLLSTAGCPQLEVLSLRHLCKLKNLEIVGQSVKLKYLEINELRMESIKICNVGLKSLRSRDTTCTDLVFENLPSIVEVDIDPHICVKIQYLGKKMLRYINAQLVQLSLHIIQSPEYLWFVCDSSGKMPIMEKLKIFKLEIEAVEDASLILVYELLLTMPYLEKLLIQIEWSDTMNNKDMFMHFKIPKCPAINHLKIVEYEGYGGRLSDHELANYFLQHYISLEKLIVKPCCPSFAATTTSKQYEKKVRLARRRARRQLMDTRVLNYSRVKLLEIL